MPPTGTFQGPPTTWYKKHRFWRRWASSAGANVPIKASVRTVPRVRSSSNVRSISSEIGVSNSALQASSSPTTRRNSSRERSGSVSVGKTRPETFESIARNATGSSTGG